MSQASTILALEWLDQNMHTSYPFAFSRNAPVTAVSGVVLPSSFIVDIQLVVDESIVDELNGMTADNARSGFYLATVSRSAESDSCILDIAFSGYGTVARSQPIPSSLQANGTLDSKIFALYPIGNTGYRALDTVQGNVVIGTVADMLDKGTLSFAESSAPLLPTRVLLVGKGLDSVSFIDVTGEVFKFHDDVVLKAGSGVDFDVNEDENTVTISDTTVIDGDVDGLVSGVLARLGDPVRSINGVGPDEDGNVLIRGGDCTEVVVGNGLRINNVCAKPCCGDVNREQLENALASLETAQARLLAYYQALTNNVNAIQARLASLLAMQ